MTIQRPVTRPLPSMRLRASQAPALSVIVPTRNEADNIRPLIVRLERALAGIDAEVLIVDDSDDATAEIACQVAAFPALPIRVHARPPRLRQGGLGGAVLVGLSEALGPVCIVMDADLQHPPELLETLLRASHTGVDFVVASRYLDGGGTEGLDGWYRQAVSRLAIWAAKRVLRPELAGVSDPMSGFFLVRKSCLDLSCLNPKGFKLLLELLIHNPQASVAEVSYTFGTRHSGISKAGFKEGLTYVNRLAKLRAQARRAPRTSRPHDIPAPSEAGTEQAAAPATGDHHAENMKRPTVPYRLKSAAHLAFLRAGRHATPRQLVNLRSMLSYLELGHWLSNEHPDARLAVVADEFALFEIARRRIVGRAPLYLEFGVFEGRSMRWWSRRLTQPDARLVGFDSFEGLPEDWRPGFAAGHFKTGKPPEIDDSRVSFQVGFFDETLPRFAVPDHDQIVMNVDADLYSSVSTVLGWAEPYLRRGTLIYFDEFWDRDHELRAFHEFRARSSRQFKPLAIAHGGAHWLFEVC
jgi:hypothetical protein